MAKKILKDVFYIILGSFVSALGLYYFVYPASFAPSGVDGIATMLQEITGINAGIYTFGINLPLIILAFIFLDKKFAIYSILSIATLSLFLILFENLQFVPQYHSETEKLIPAVFSGLMIGLRTGLVLKAGGSSGGVDIIAAIIQKKNPYINIETYITIICYVIIASSFFVYGVFESILLSIVQMFVFEKTVSFVMKSKRNAVEFKIVTSDPDALKEDILINLKHGATVIHGQGMFTGADKSVILCVVNLRQIPEFMNILKKHDNIFVYCTQISSVNGNFRWNRDDVAK